MENALFCILFISFVVACAPKATGEISGERASRLIDAAVDAMERGDFARALNKYDTLLLSHKTLGCLDHYFEQSIASAYLGRGLAFYELGLYSDTMRI